MEIPSGRHHINIGWNDTLSVTYSDNEHSGIFNTISFDNIIPGDWSCCCIDDSEYILCTNEIYNDIINVNTIAEFESEEHFALSPEESNALTLYYGNLKRRSSMSEKILSSLEIKTISNKPISSPFVVFTINNNSRSLDKWSIANKTNEAAMNMFLPRIEDIEDDTYKGLLCSMFQEKTYLSYIKGVSGGICGLVIDSYNEDEQNSSIEDIEISKEDANILNEVVELLLKKKKEAE